MASPNNNNSNIIDAILLKVSQSKQGEGSLTKREQKILSEYRDKSALVWEEALEDNGTRGIVKQSPMGPTSLRPGDVVQFAYHMVYKTHTVTRGIKRYLVVSTLRGPTGSFNSTRGNNLLCCYEINENIANIKKLLSSLYKNRIRCTYKRRPTLLNLVLGSALFRTFNHAGMIGTSEIYIELNNKKGKKSQDPNPDIEI